MEDFKIGRAYSLPSVTSVMLAELVAISVALDLGLDLRVREIRVHTDSQSALQFLHGCLSTLSLTHPLVVEIAVKLHGAREAGCNVILDWVPGHANIWGNDMADELSRSSTGEQIVTLTASARDLDTVVAATVRSMWEDSWFSEGTGRALFNLHPSVSRPFELDHLPRASAVVLSRMRVGQVSLNKLLHAMGRLDSPGCYCGAPMEDVSHFLLDCVLYDVQRRTLRSATKGEVTLLGLLGVWPHAGGYNYKNLRAVARFCAASGRFAV